MVRVQLEEPNYPVFYARLHVTPLPRGRPRSKAIPNVSIAFQPGLSYGERPAWTARRDADNIDYEVTVEDPNVFSRPWTLRKKLWKRAEEDYVLFEYACHEGNVGWENIKKGLIGKPAAP